MRYVQRANGGVRMTRVHAHVTRHGLAADAAAMPTAGRLPSSRTIRDREQSEAMAIDTAAYYVRDLIARPDGAHVPTMLDYAPDGVSCPWCSDGLRGRRVYASAIATRDGAIVGAVHVNLCPIMHY